MHTIGKAIRPLFADPVTYVVYVHLITNQIELILLCFLNSDNLSLKYVE